MATEEQVQSAVWNIDLGRGKRVLQWLVVVLSAIALSLVYTAGQFRGLEKRESMDLAQLARNIARGEGFTTHLIRPLSLWHLKNFREDHDQKFMDHPDLYNPPLYPLVLAGMFKLLPDSVFEMKPMEYVYAPERWVILPFNQICLLLSVLLVYFWSQRLFDRRVALLAGLLMLFSDTLWSYGVSGLPTTFLMLLLLSSIYCLFVADQRLHPAPSAAEPSSADSPAPPATPSATIPVLLVLASAVLLGLCFLTRYLTGFLVVPLGIYVARVMRRRRGWAWAAIYVAIVLAIITPWLVRNYRVSSSFLGIARYQIVETEALDRTYHVDLSGAYSVHRFASRFIVYLRGQLLDAVKNIGSDFLIFFFATGLMYSFRRPDVARLRRVVLGALATSIVATCVIGGPGDHSPSPLNGENLLVLFLPLVAVFGAAFFFLLLDQIAFRMKLTHALAIGAFALANLAPMIFTMLPPRRGTFPYPPYCPPYVNLLKQWFTKNETGTSDMPWEVAWYADRRALWLPLTQEEFADIHDFVAPHNTQFILFTPYMLDSHLQSEIIKGDYKDWAWITRGQVPNAFPLKAATILPPAQDQVLLADRPRWLNRPATELIEKPPASTNAPAASLAPE